MKSLILRSLLFVSVCVFLQACGNKGDLYMPDSDKDQGKTEVSSDKKQTGK